MFAHVLVLLLGCACTLGIHDIGLPNIPPYIKAFEDYQELRKTLSSGYQIDENKTLYDYRGQYGIIVNVILQEAISQSGCLRTDYDEEYQKVLVEPVIEGLSDPKKVIAATNDLLDSVDDYIKNLTDAMNNCLASTDDCNARTDDVVKQDKATYAPQAELLFTVSDAAEPINKQRELYKYVAKSMGAVQFVVNGQKVLKVPVLGLSDVYRIINYYRGVKC